MKMKMKINNHEEYVYAFEMLKGLVDAIEDYASNKEVVDLSQNNEDNAQVLNNFYSWKPIKRDKSINVQQFEHPVKGSLAPQHPLDDSGPRGHTFFKTLDTKVNEPRGVCPGQLT